MVAMAAAKEDIDKSLECPICLDYFEKPIKQCVIGHSFCGKCLDPIDVKKCPECRSGVLDTRNYKLEELLDNFPYPCINKSAGCPYKLQKELMIEHILECKHRTFKCEGKRFCKWKCNWEGHDVLEHFKSKHPKHTSLEYTASVTILFNNVKYFTDIQIISAHYQLFWYKHKIDLEKQKAYWTFQYIGPRKQAEYYYYEFEIYNEEDNTRKFKITEYCKSDIVDVESIFNSENCVAISFAMLKSYVDKKNMYSFRFRLMKKQNPVKQRSKSATRRPVTKNKNLVDMSANVQRLSLTDDNGPIWLPHVQHRFDSRPNYRK